MEAHVYANAQCCLVWKISAKMTLRLLHNQVVISWDALFSDLLRSQNLLMDEAFSFSVSTVTVRCKGSLHTAL